MEQFYGRLRVNDTDLPLLEPGLWTDARPDTPCTILANFGALCVELGRRLDEMDGPGHLNRVFIRVPIIMEDEDEG